MYLHQPPRSLTLHQTRGMGNLLTLLRRSTVPAATPYGNPLPHVIHQVVCSEELGPGRLVVVGDVHGCFDELQALLGQVQFQHGKDNLILVGDLVNKGPKSKEVVAAVKEWASQGHCWAVRGNHCDAALAARRQLDQGQRPVKPKFAWVDQLLPAEVQFMQQLPFSLRLPGYQSCVVHAGLVPGRPLEQQQLKDLVKMRDLQQQSPSSNQEWVAVEKPAEGSHPWAAQWKGPGHVFFGHDAKKKLQLHPHATGLDTGCCYGGQLTCCVLPPLSVLQQDPMFASAAAAAAAVGGDSGSSGGAQQDALCPTLQQLQGQLSSVQSSSVYEKPSRKSTELPPAAGSHTG